MGGKEQDYISKAFEENWIAPLGPNVTGFEEDIRDYLDHKVEVAALSSGTAALHLALIIAGVQKGDDVLCQSLTFAASANPITYVDANPVFVDSEPETLNICPNYLEDAIVDRIAHGKKPKAIIAVHLYGMPYDVESVARISNKFGIPVIEDSAEALGSSYKGRKCGTFGDCAILSFNGNKIITTSGGGALVTKNPSSKEKAIFLATQARDQAPHYQHSEIGFNYRLSNVCAGIGRGQMEVLDEHITLRRRMNEFYSNLFRDMNGVTVYKEPDNDYYCNHWLTVVTIDPEKAGFDREELRLRLEKENIESRPLWKPMHLQPVFSEAPFYGGHVSASAFEKGLCLPSGSNLTDEEKKRIENTITEFLR